MAIQAKKDLMAIQEKKDLMVKKDLMAIQEMMDLMVIQEMMDLMVIQGMMDLMVILEMMDEKDLSVRVLGLCILDQGNSCIDMFLYMFHYNNLHHPNKDRRYSLDRRYHCLLGWVMEWFDREFC